MSSTRGHTIVRPARPADIAAVNAIHRHYVLRTVSTFALEPLAVAAALAKYEAIRAAGLPYLVADVAMQDGTLRVAGFAYVSPFRGALDGYRHTAELSLYCAPDMVGQRVGHSLLAALLDVLYRPEMYDDEWLGAERRADAKVEQVLSVMALDETDAKRGHGLKAWYERFGFKQVGHLQKVGRKFDRWLDTIYLQLDVGDSHGYRKINAGQPSYAREFCRGATLASRSIHMAGPLC